MVTLGKVEVDIQLLVQLQEQLITSANAIAAQLEEPEVTADAAKVSNAPVAGFQSTNLLDEKPEKFELLPNGVPVLTTTAPKRHSMLSSKSSVSSVTLDDSVGGRMLDEWREKFVLSQQEAIDIYTEMHRAKSLASPKKGFGFGRRPSQTWQFQDWMPVNAAEWQLSTISVKPKELLRLWRLTWDFLTIVLVATDAIILPIRLAWPDRFVAGGPVDELYKVTPVFWVVDILMNFAMASLSQNKIKVLLTYTCSWLWFDVCLVVLDFVLMLEMVPDSTKALTLFRLFRFAKFRHAMTELETLLEARGMVRAKHISTILQCVIFILGVNHVLACVTVYVARREQTQQRINWMDENQVSDNSIFFQYMISFNWVIAEYTPAPYPFTATNEMEQALVLVIILTCLPMLGAQIGIISGTLNKMNEKTKERETIKRDLQRWLRKTKAHKALTQRVVAALDEVLKSGENPLDFREPLALDFLPTTLIQELHVVNTSDKICIHPFFSMLLDERLELGGRLAACFQSKVYIHGEAIFSEGRRAEGIHIATQGGFSFLPSKSENFNFKQRVSKSMHWNNDAWFAELSLYSPRIHVSTLTAATYAKTLLMTCQSFLDAVQDWPATVVAIHEYAQSFLKFYEKRAHNLESTWELPPQDWAEEAVASTQLAELLIPGTSRLHSFKMTEVPQVPVNFHRLLSREKDEVVNSLEDQIEEVQEITEELQEDTGIYDALGCQEEAQRATLSMLCLGWFVRDSYHHVITTQDQRICLSKSTWDSIRELLFCSEMTFDELNGLMVLLAIRGICKSPDFAKIVPPSERTHPEQVLSYAVENLQAYLPSLASLGAETQKYLGSVAHILSQFNFAQFLQGENNPHSVWLLKNGLENQGEKVLKMCLLAQVCILCGVMGTTTLKGSLFLNEANGRCLMKALHCLQQIHDLEPHAVYWKYIQSRAEALNLPVQNPSHLVQARLACLTRCVENQMAAELQDDWLNLTQKEREVLHDIFLLDGHEQKTFVFLYLPLFLTNAKVNHDVDLLGALKFLVEIYDRLLQHRCLMLTGPSVRVDLSSLALVVKDVEEISTLRKCFDFAKLVKHENGVTVLLTSNSYQVMSGQLVHHTRSADMLEQLTAQQSKLESAIRSLPIANHRHRPSVSLFSSESELPDMGDILRL